MNLEIKNKNREFLALIEVSSSGINFIGPEPVLSFREFVSDALEKGISEFREEEEKGVIKILERRVMPPDTNFPLIFKNFIERNGYSVLDERALAIREEIESILSALPDSDDKKSMLEKIQKLFCAELVLMLQELKKSE